MVIAPAGLKMGLGGTAALRPQAAEFLGATLICRKRTIGEPMLFDSPVFKNIAYIHASSSPQLSTSHPNLSLFFKGGYQVSNRLVLDQMY